MKAHPIGKIAGVLAIGFGSFVPTLAVAGNETGNSGPRISSVLSETADRSKILFYDVLFDRISGRPIGRPVPELKYEGGSVISPDGLTAAAYSATFHDGDDRAALWDVKTGRKIFNFGSSRDLSYVNFTPDGSRIVTADYRSGTIQVWNASSGEVLGEIRNIADPVTGISWNSKILVVGSTLWSLETFSKILSLPDHAPYVNRNQLVNQGRTLATAQDDYSKPERYELLIFDLVKRQPVSRFGVDVMGFSVNPGADRAVTFNEKNVKLWNAQNGQLLAKKNNAITNEIKQVVISSDGSRAALIDDYDRIWLWNTETGDILKTHQSAGEQTFLFDGMLAVENHHMSKSLFLFSFEDASLRQSYVVPRGDMPFISKDGSVVIPEVGQFGRYGDRPMESVRIFDGRTGELSSTLTQPFGGPIYPMQLSPSGRYLLTSTVHDYGTGTPPDHSLYSLWDLRENRKVIDLKDREIRDISDVFSAGERYFALLDRAAGLVEIRSTADGSLIRSLALDGFGRFRVNFHPKRDIVLYGNTPYSDYSVRAYDIVSGALVYQRDQEYTEPYLTICEGGARALSGFTVWDLDTGKTLLEAGGGDIAALSGDGKTLYIQKNNVSPNSRLRIWDVDRQTMTREVDLGVRTSAVRRLVVSPDGQFMLLHIDPSPGFMVIDTKEFKPVYFPIAYQSPIFFGDHTLAEMPGEQDLIFRNVEDGSLIGATRMY